MVFVLCAPFLALGVWDRNWRVHSPINARAISKVAQQGTLLNSILLGDSDFRESPRRGVGLSSESLLLVFEHGCKLFEFRVMDHSLTLAE